MRGKLNVFFSLIEIGYAPLWRRIESKKGPAAPLASQLVAIMDIVDTVDITIGVECIWQQWPIKAIYDGLT